jgi:hypothetical protein
MPSSARASLSFPGWRSTNAAGITAVFSGRTFSIDTMRPRSASETATKRLAKRPTSWPSSNFRSGWPW